MTEEHEVEVIEDIDQNPLPDPREQGYRHRDNGRIHRGGQSVRMDTLTWALILSHAYGQPGLPDTLSGAL